MDTESCDILVIGSGIAGLNFALHCAENFSYKKIVLLNKNSSRESNTYYAQGGIAAVMDQLNDSFEQHIQDTLQAGDGLCDKEIVIMVVNEAPEQIHKLQQWGVAFDQTQSQFELAKEGGHDANRILHCKDHTGTDISESLLKRAREYSNIEVRENEKVLELITAKQNGESICLGARILANGQQYFQKAYYTMLASGGAGQLLKLTSNPVSATGDGIALALNVGAELKDMAFVQFHPTALYEGDVSQSFLISEAVRGYGGVLRDHDGNEFIYRYDRRGSLATRDIISRAMFNEMQASFKPYLWLDLRHLLMFCAVNWH